MSGPSATTAIAPAIADAEQQRAMRKPPGSLDAWAAYQRGLWHVSKATPDDNSLAEKFFQQALDLDPSFSGAYGGLATAQAQAAEFHTRGLAEALSSFETLARRAISLDGADAEARSLLSNALWGRGDYEGALAEAERALATTPNLAYPHHMLGTTLIFSGRPKEGYFSQEYAAAVEVAKQAIRSNPDFPNPYRWLAAALGQLGRIGEAKEALEKAMVIVPGSFDMYVRKRVPWMRPEDHAHMLEGLRKAGMPEE